VHAHQALLLQLLNDLMQDLQLVEVLLGHPVPPVMMGSGAVTGEYRERRVGIIPQVKPLFVPPLHQFGHRDIEIGIDTLPGLDVDNHAP
jgi:hypothetical protein